MNKFNHDQPKCFLCYTPQTHFVHDVGMAAIMPATDVRCRLIHYNAEWHAYVEQCHHVVCPAE